MVVFKFKLKPEFPTLHDSDCPPEPEKRHDLHDSSNYLVYGAFP